MNYCIRIARVLVLVSIVFFAVVKVKNIFDKPSDDRPKLMWLDLSANWERFSNPDSCAYYIDKCKDAGFNAIVVDVKGLSSAVAYDSDIAPRLKEWRGITRPDDYDYLKLMTNLGHERGMKVYAAFNIFCEGHGNFGKGHVYEAHKDWQSMHYVAGMGIVPVTSIPGKVGGFVNPALPEVQEYETSILVECATKYEVDGIMIDRARYDGIESDFSDYSRQKFEEYIGQKVERFPEDIYEWVKNDDGTYYRVPGKWQEKWFEWRASNIYKFVKDTRRALKTARADVQFAAYTGAWYPSYFELGVNWASRKYDPSADYDWATPEYKNYGFYELLDLYTNGNYYKSVTLEELHASGGMYKTETDSDISSGDHLCVEGACRLSRKVLDGGKFLGGLYVEDYTGDVEQFKKAIRMNLKESDGLMVFDIVHIINKGWWKPLEEAVKNPGE